MKFHEAIYKMCERAIELSKDEARDKNYQLAISHNKQEYNLLCGVVVKGEPLKIEWNMLNIDSIPLDDNGFSLTTISVPTILY